MMKSLWAYPNVVTRADPNHTQLQPSAQQSQQSTATRSNRMHNLHMHGSISVVERNRQKAANLSRRRLPERDGRGRFIAKTSTPHTGTNTPGTNSDFQLLSDQEPQSPQDVASTRPLPPSPRPTVTPKTLSITNPNGSALRALPDTWKMTLGFGGVVDSTYYWLQYCSLDHVTSFTQSRDMGILKQQVHGKGFFTFELVTRILFKTFYNCYCLLIQTKIDM